MDVTQPNVQHAQLETITAADLQKADIQPLRYIVEDILPEGLSILVAPPKFGKSWMSLDLCLSVAAGKPFLGYPTHSGDCLYLALEDSFRRLQNRQERLLQGATAPANCSFAIAAGTLDGSLAGQIDTFMQTHHGTALIVIDVLARVRSQTTTSRTDAYRLDYSDMTVLKQLADKHHICIMVVHHTRKMRDDSDVFNDVSGSTGITGAADTAFVLCKDKRADTRGTLHIIGRDVEAQECIVEMDNNCHWQRIGSTDEVHAQQAMLEFKANPLVQLIQHMVAQADEPELKITAAGLLDALMKQPGTHGGFDSSKKVGRFLASADTQLRFREIGIEYSNEKTQFARWLVFRRLIE